MALPEKWSTQHPLRSESWAGVPKNNNIVHAYPYRLIESDDTALAKPCASRPLSRRPTSHSRPAPTWPSLPPRPCLSLYVRQQPSTSTSVKTLGRAPAHQHQCVSHIRPRGFSMSYVRPRHPLLEQSHSSGILPGREGHKRLYSHLDGHMRCSRAVGICTVTTTTRAN